MNARRKSLYNISKIKYLISALLILLAALIMTVIAYFAAFALTVLTGGVNISDTSSATVNQTVFNILRYSLMIIIFGWLYYRAIRTTSDNSIETHKSLKLLKNPIVIPSLIIMGLAIQAGTDGILYILSNAFPDAFESYKELMTEFTGNVSVLYIITVVLPGPVAEELIFRGLILRQCCNFAGISDDAASSEKTPDSSSNPLRKRYMIANIIQALLFGLYHGNLIQGIYAFIFGLLLGDLTNKTGSLIIPICLHMIINGSLYIIPEDFFSSIPGAAVISGISLVIVIVSYILLNKVSTGNPISFKASSQNKSSNDK